MNKKIQELVIDGETYVPKSSISQPTLSSDVKIVVLQRGWIYVGRFNRVGNDCTLTNASCIRNWGTTKGLPELVNGPTNKTVLDPCQGIVSFDWLTVIHTIDCNPSNWKI